MVFAVPTLVAAHLLADVTEVGEDNVVTCQFLGEVSVILIWKL